MDSIMGSMGSILHRVMDVSDEVNDLKRTVADLRGVAEEINMKTDSMPLKVEQLFRQQTAEITEVLLEIKSFMQRWKTDMKRQELRQQQTKRQLTTVMTNLEKVERQNAMYKDQLLKTESSTNELKQVSLRTTERVPKTPRPAQRISEKTRLIITSMAVRNREWSQLDLHTNILTKLPFPDLGVVTSLVYVESTQRVVLGVASSPLDQSRIMSVTLDGRNMETLKENIYTVDMAVDEDRGLIFLLNWEPFTIGKMSVRGENYTVVYDLNRYGNPYSIDVNSRSEEVYVCTTDTLTRVSYSGDAVEALMTGHSLVRLTFDSLGNDLYFNMGKHLMKLSLADRVITEMIIMEDIPWKISYYNNTVFYGGGSDTRYVGAVQLGGEPVDLFLQAMGPEYRDPLVICLVP